MKTHVKVNIASPQRILEWTERILPDGLRIGEVTQSVKYN